MLVSEAVGVAPGTRYTVNTYLRGEIDSLGSASVVADINGGLLSETMYKPGPYRVLRDPFGALRGPFAPGTWHLEPTPYMERT